MLVHQRVIGYECGAKLYEIPTNVREAEHWEFHRLGGFHEIQPNRENNQHIFDKWQNGMGHIHCDCHLD